MNTITTRNNTDDKRVWITIYNPFGNQADSGWCDVGSAKDWGPYDVPGPYKVRGEVKSDMDGSDPNVYDTEISVAIYVFSPAVNAVRILKGDGNYYWEFYTP